MVQVAETDLVESFKVSPWVCRHTKVPPGMIEESGVYKPRLLIPTPPVTPAGAIRVQTTSNQS